MVLDPDLMEWDYGEYEGRTREEIREERPGWELFRDGCPGGESFAEVSARVGRVIDRTRQMDGDVAVFAHGHLLRTLAVCWLGKGPDLGPALPLSAATVSMLGRDREVAVIALWNDGGHLEGT